MGRVLLTTHGEEETPLTELELTTLQILSQENCVKCVEKSSGSLTMRASLLGIFRFVVNVYVV